MQLRVAILVASDRISQGEEKDASGVLAAELLAEIADVAEIRVVPDEEDRIAEALLDWCSDGMDIVLTLGGTGLGPRDVTPEATRRVIERETPGITTALLVRGLQSTPRAMLSRATSGVHGRTLVINLPGSTAAVRELVPYLCQVLPHAVEVLSGKPEEYRK